MNIQLVYKFFNRLIDWLFRRRSIASILVTTGGMIVVTALSISFAAQVKIDQFELSISTAGGVAQTVTTIALVVGLLVVLLGVAIATLQMLKDARRESRKKVIMVELRGLRDSSDAPLFEAEIGNVAGRREELLVDLRQAVHDGTIVDPNTALKRLNLLPSRISAVRSGMDRRDIEVITGGLAPVPFLVVAGMLMDDESPVEIMDWDRSNKVWSLLEASDDGERFSVVGLEAIAKNAMNVVVGVSVSYRVSGDAISTTFPDWPIVSLELPDPRIDVHWSREKQAALCKQFVEVVGSLASKSVRQVHLVMAVPASLAIRFGMGYDKRNMPDAIVYQYEKSSSPPYPWGIRLPTHGVSEAEIIPPSG